MHPSRVSAARSVAAGQAMGGVGLALQERPAGCRPESWEWVIGSNRNGLRQHPESMPEATFRGTVRMPAAGYGMVNCSMPETTGLRVATTAIDAKPASFAMRPISSGVRVRPCPMAAK